MTASMFFSLMLSNKRVSGGQAAATEHLNMLHHTETLTTAD